MFEFLGLIVFSLIVFSCLVVIPSCIETLSNPEFRSAYLAHLGGKHVNTYGK